MTPPERDDGRLDPARRDAGRLLEALDAARARRRRPTPPTAHTTSATTEVAPGAVPRRRPR